MSTDLPVKTFIFISSVVSLVTNILLIFICLRIRHKAKVVVYVIALCLADLLSPMISIAEIIFVSITNTSTVDHENTCQIIGSLIISHPLIVTIFAVALAFKRLSHVNSLDYNKIYWTAPLIVVSSIYLIIISLAASKNELVLAPSRVHCQLYPQNSTLSAFVFYFLAITVMIGAILVIYCYSRIAMFAANTSNAIMLEDRPSLSVLDPEQSTKISKTKFKQTIQNHFHISSIRIWIIVTLYAMFMIPGTILYLVEGTMDRDPEYQSGTKYVLSSLAMVLFFTGSLMNPVLAVFLHTGILNAVKKFFRINTNRSTQLNC